MCSVCPCAPACPVRVPCVSRLPPVSFYRYRFRVSVGRSQASAAYVGDLRCRRRRMQAALDQVAQHCVKELDAYSACVDKHPHRWQSMCVTLKADLKECATKK